MNTCLCMCVIALCLYCVVFNAMVCFMFSMNVIMVCHMYDNGLNRLINCVTHHEACSPINKNKNKYEQNE